MASSRSTAPDRCNGTRAAAAEQVAVRYGARRGRSARVEVLTREPYTPKRTDRVAGAYIGRFVPSTSSPSRSYAVPRPSRKKLEGNGLTVERTSNGRCSRGHRTRSRPATPRRPEILEAAGPRTSKSTTNRHASAADGWGDRAQRAVRRHANYLCGRERRWVVRAAGYRNGERRGIPGMAGAGRDLMPECMWAAATAARLCFGAKPHPRGSHGVRQLCCAPQQRIANS